MAASQNINVLMWLPLVKIFRHGTPPAGSPICRTYTGGSSKTEHEVPASPCNGFSTGHLHSRVFICKLAFALTSQMASKSAMSACFQRFDNFCGCPVLPPKPAPVDPDSTPTSADVSITSGSTLTCSKPWFAAGLTLFVA